MGGAAASVDSRAAAILSTEAMESALNSEKRLSLMLAVSAVHVRPRPESLFSRSAKGRNGAAKAKVTSFRSQMEGMPMSETESRVTNRARLNEKL